MKMVGNDWENNDASEVDILRHFLHFRTTRHVETFWDNSEDSDELGALRLFSQSFPTYPYPLPHLLFRRTE